MNEYRILLVDDEVLILASIGRALELRGYAVATASGGRQAIALLESENFDLVITDLVMGEVDGIQVLKRAKEIDPETMVVILTGYGNMESAIDALRHQAEDYLLKPCDPEVLHFTVARCLEKLELKRKIRIYEQFLSVCCICKRIRDDANPERPEGEWLTLEEYVARRTRLKITHGCCPRCYEEEIRKMEEE